MGNADRDWNHQGREDALAEGQKPKEDKVVEPNFGLSGKLAEETNKVNGVVLMHNEPPEARKPGLRWRLYTFKNGVRAATCALSEHWHLSLPNFCSACNTFAQAFSFR